ncbi:MAG: (Fe-S)-binding protein, partial [Candidatus Bathyarchaeia archaeon]
KALGDPGTAKILGIRRRGELDDFNSKLNGDVIASCSLADLEGSTLILRRQDDELKQKIIKYFEYFIEVKRIAGELPGLNCGRCSYPSCIEMAKAIYRGEERLEKCPVASSSLDVEVKVGDSKVPMQPFVARIIKSTILGMISSLKGVEVRGDEKLKIEII